MMRHPLIIRAGNFLFHYRNGLFPLFYLLLFIPGPELFKNNRTAFLIGLFVSLAGQLLRMATIGLEYVIRGGKNRQIFAKKLVTGGLFAHCRNPLYDGNLLMLLGLGLAANSWLFLSAGMVLFLGVYHAIVAAEEDFLRTKFGSEFDSYCSQVRRFVPRLSGLGQTLTGMAFNWRRVITAEYGSTFIWLWALILSTMQNLFEHGHTRFGDPLQRLGLLALITVLVAFLAARILKKSGRLASPQMPADVGPTSKSEALLAARH